MPTPFDHTRSTRSRSSRPAAQGVGSLGIELLEDRIALAGNGLTGQYFHNADFTGLAFERTEAVDFNWEGGSPASSIDAETFSVRWIGQVEAEFSETYTFRTVSDNGVRLWVDGKLLIDNWVAHATQVDTAQLTPEAGGRYDLRLEYFENTGSAEMRLQWESASQALEAIPASQLHESSQGLWGDYWDGFGGAGTRVDPMLDFDWGTSRPISTVAVDNFNARWTGFIRPEYSEEYTFSTLSDEGVRVWVGDELVIDHWAPHSATSQTGSKVLEAGKWYDLRVEYFDVSGSAEVELSWLSEGQTGGAFEIIPSENLRAARHAPLYVTNPLGQGQDPFVIRWQDSYLHVRSAGASVWIDRADRLEDIHSSTPESTSTRAWQAPAGTNYSQQIWAPELHQINGKWYIYVAASDGDNATHRMHVLERDNANPIGSYIYKGQLASTTDRWAIDGTVFQWQDKLYTVWSGWPGTSNVQQNLYIAEMSNPWTISGERVLLAQPTLTWERHGLPINEGPQVLINNGQLHIIYSGSGYWTPNYALGRLTYNGVGPIKSASSWTKSPTPVFQATSEIVGVGHASFTTSPDGTQNWIVYHAHPSPGGNPDARVIRIQQFAFTASGTPNFGSPAPLSAKIEVPSGYPDADRPFLAGDFDANGVVNSVDLIVLRLRFGLETFPGNEMGGGDFLTWQRQLGATATTASASASSSSSAALHAAVPGGDSPSTALRGLSGRSPFISSEDAARIDVVEEVYAHETTFDLALAEWSVRPGDQVTSRDFLREASELAVGVSPGEEVLLVPDLAHARLESASEIHPAIDDDNG